MKNTRVLKSLILAAFLFAPWPCWAGPSVSVMDTAKPPVIDGDLSDWTGAPTLVMDKKEHVVMGAAEWAGPSLLSAKVWITYDATNLYVAADISSKGPQFNAQDGRNIYNGDSLELYIGTDNSNPARTTYAPTDYQIGFSPGKNGDKTLVFSFKDEGKLPGAVMGTKMTTNGYTIEGSIPLEFLFKIDVGPGKTIGFDVGVNDIGPASKARVLQLMWSGSDKGWSEPSVWGSLTFKGATTFKNEKPKVDMTNAGAGNTDPNAGKAEALTTGSLLWGFNGDNGGFEGKTSWEPFAVTEGTHALAIDVEGSQGWNQSLALTANIPMGDKWKDFKAISFDLFYPKGSLKDAQYGEFYVITQSQVNSFNQLKFFVIEGWNHLYMDVDAAQFEGGVYKVMLIFNSGGPLHGKVYVDNFRGHLKGVEARLRGMVANDKGQPLAGAILAVNRKAVKTGPDGVIDMSIPEDNYVAEIFCPGYKTEKINLKIAAGESNRFAVNMKPISWTVKNSKVDAFFDKKVRKIDPHYMFGNNIAPWNKPDSLTNPIAIEKMRRITPYIRVPGGGYANIWNWKTADTYKKDGTGVNWNTDIKWDHMANFIKQLGPNSEVLMTANIMTMSVQDTLDWIADIKKRGLKLRYVEMGNEPDYESALFYKGQKEYWTVIDNYCRHFLEYAKAVKAAYPDLKIMGPTSAQVENRQRKEGSPWLADPNAPWWISTFLQKCGPYVDVVSVHTYPYWNNDNDATLLLKTNMWEEWVPKIRAAIKQYCPDRADKIEIALTEWNSGDENATTAHLVNGIFGADFLGQMMLWGINQTNVWDMCTQKPALGGGHGVLDPGDPDNPYAERSMYWAIYMVNNHFGTQICQAATDEDMRFVLNPATGKKESKGTGLLSAYASEGAGAKWLMVVNKSPSTAFKAPVNLGALTGKHKLDFYTLSENEYMWSENLYRAVINKKPTHTVGSVTVGNRFQYTFPPYSVTCIKISPVAAATAK